MATALTTWMTGDACSGKTTGLVEAFRHWLQQEISLQEKFTSSVIILAANHTTRHQLARHLTASVGGEYPIVIKTPLGFIEDEVNLFAPLWWEKLNLPPQFTLRLRSETEQALAMENWHSHWPVESIPNRRTEARLVRTTLDILQLAAASGTPFAEIPAVLISKLSAEEKAAFGNEEIFPIMGALIMQWRDWCLQRGFLTYGLIYYLYGQVLLPNATYQEQLKRRYQGIFADDVDDYPAIAQDLARLLLQENATGVFTFNPNGKVRLGLSADPDTWETLADQCHQVSLSSSLSPSPVPTPTETIPTILQMIDDPSSLELLPDCIRNLQTSSRAQLLRETAETLIQTIKKDKIAPADIAIIAPGLDEIARYTLMRIFRDHGYSVYPLNEQRPLVSSSLVRALLTLTCLVYPDLGRLIEANAVAEMLVVLTEHSSHKIDPVRAGLITDHCYQADPSSPRLLDIKTFSRWDRIGYEAHSAYQEVCHWIEQQKADIATPPDLVHFLNQGIQKFLWKGNNLSVADLSSLRELTETTQHYWEVQSRKQEQEHNAVLLVDQIADFIQLLKQGTITANPTPMTSFNPALTSGITLSNIFQYRSQRVSHRLQVWLDVGSPLWLKQGAANLLGASAFLRGENQDMEAETHLKRIVTDLLNRATEKVYLCHSDLAVNGTEQTGILLTLVQASTAIKKEAELSVKQLGSSS